MLRDRPLHGPARSRPAPAPARVASRSGRAATAAAAVWLAAVQVPAAAAQAVTPPPAASVTLDEAVRLALRASPEIARVEGDVRVAGAVERSARASYLPDLLVESNTLRASTPSPISQPGVFGGVADRTAAAGVSSNLDLYTGGRRGAERRRATALREAGDAGLLEQRASVTLLAQRAVFDVLRARDLVRVDSARVARATQGLAFARTRHSAGVATLSDELRARLELSTARQQLARSASAVRNARFALGRTVGVAGAVDARPVDSLAPRPLALSDSAIVALSVGSSPTVRTVEAELRAADAAVRAARTRYAPTVQLGGAYRVLGQANGLNAINGVPTTPRDGQVWGLRLGLAYPVFDRLQREEAVTRARAASGQTDARARDERLAAGVNAQRALEALRVAEAQIGLADEGVQAATEDLRVVRVRYRAGAATILDLITSQTNLSTAESSLVNARFDYAVSRAELVALLGRPL